jgi:hypothetical protein
MACSARLVAGGAEINAAAMFGVAFGTSEFSFVNETDRVMDGAVVTREAAQVGSLRGECSGLLHVARSAFSFKDRMRCRQPAAAVNAGILVKSAFRDPNKREQWQQEAKPEFRALQRRRPLKIIQVDALREFLCCACACHVLRLKA